MKTKKAPLSIRIMLWLTNVVVGLLMLIAIFSILINILLHTGFIGEDIQLHTQFPVKVDFNEIGTLVMNDQTINVKLVNASTKIHFIDTPVFIAKKVAVVLSLVVLGILYIMILFRRFIKNVKNGLTFNISNIKILKKISYSIVFFWLFTEIYMHIYYYYIATRVEFENIKISTDVDNYPWILVLALVIWVLAHVFTKGLEIQKENDLTI